MRTLPEFVGTIHIFLGPYRGNPIALYLRQEGESCHISPTIYPWNRFVGVGETVNKAAADFDLKWKEGDLTADMYSGPHWEGGIKPEKPKPPPKPAAPKPATATEGTTKTEGTSTPTPKIETPASAGAKPETPASASPQAAPPDAVQVKPDGIVATPQPSTSSETKRSEPSTPKVAQPESSSENPAS